jgi:hypothetical protein
MRKPLSIVTAVLVFCVLVSLTLHAYAKDDIALPKDWNSYRHIGSLIITDKAHPLFGIHHFYMNKKGLSAFEKGEKYPDGTVIVDSVYEIKQDGAILNEGNRAFFPVMKKNSRMKDTGGWEWAAFGADGKRIEKDPKKDCFSCHEPMKDNDYVFSKPLK